MEGIINSGTPGVLTLYAVAAMCSLKTRAWAGQQGVTCRARVLSNLAQTHHGTGLSPEEFSTQGDFRRQTLPHTAPSHCC